MMVVSVCASVVLLLLLRSPNAADAQLLIDGTPETDNECYSTTDGLVKVTATFASPPTADRVPIFTSFNEVDPIVAPALTIRCASIIETAPLAAATDSDPACAGASRLFLCSTPTTDTTAWSCEALVEYTYASAVTVSRGSQTGPQLRWRLEVSLGASAARCFPRNLQLVALVTTEQQQAGSTALFVFFAIVLTLVLVCAGAVLVFGLRKRARNLQDRDLQDDGQQGKSNPTLAAMMGLEKNTSFTSLPELAVGATPGEPLHGTDGEYAPQPLPIAEVRRIFAGEGGATAGGGSPLPFASASRPDVVHSLAASSAAAILNEGYQVQDNFDAHLGMMARVPRAVDGQPSLYVRSFAEDGGLGGAVGGSRSLSGSPASPSSAEPRGGTFHGIVEWSPSRNPAVVELPTAIPAEVLQRISRSPRQPPASSGGRDRQRSTRAMTNNVGYHHHHHHQHHVSIDTGGSNGGGSTTTLACADCGAVAQDRHTPKRCPVSGLRHY